MKKRLFLLAVLALMLSAAAAGTAAYFSVKGDTANSITMGNVKMLLHDETADGKAFPENGLNGLMPGEKAGKVVYVENTGDNAFYSRIKLENTVTPEKGDAKPGLDKIQLNIDTANWQLGADGWYYYKSAVEKGGKTAPLFTEVTLASNMGNDYMNASVRIKVTAQAVQQANNGGTAWQAAGWPVE